MQQPQARGAGTADASDGVLSGCGALSVLRGGKQNEKAFFEKRTVLKQSTKN
jgi:hypothetical protein